MKRRMNICEVNSSLQSTLKKLFITEKFKYPLKERSYLTTCTAALLSG
jgi:hypothetical protein